jgi:hypothetical protein
VNLSLVMLPKQVAIMDNEVLVIKDCSLDYCVIFCSMQKEVLNVICESDVCAFC